MTERLTVADLLPTGAGRALRLIERTEEVRRSEGSPTVAFWEGVSGGTAHLRCRTPAGALERIGWGVNYIQKVDDPIESDVLVLQRVVGDFVPDIIRKLKRRTSTLVVYDIDDWYEGIPDYNRASKVLTAENLRVVRELMGLADLITVSTPELAEGYASIGPTVVLPNYLDPEIWLDNEKYRVPHPKIHLGWMGAFHWRSGDLDLLKPWIKGFLDDHPEVTFVSCGAPELFEYLGISGLTTPKMRENAKDHLRPYAHLPAMLAQLDIGLVPMTQNRFNQAKSWLKGMEYGAMGVPAVASASREYRSYIRPGVNGLLVRKNNWPQQIEAVMADLDSYKRRARKVAEEHFIDDHIGKWVDAYGRARRDLRPGRPVPAPLSRSA